jgi:hypothetical protein
MRNQGITIIGSGFNWQAASVLAEAQQNRSVQQQMNTRKPSSNTQTCGKQGASEA